MARSNLKSSVANRTSTRVKQATQTQGPRLKSRHSVYRLIDANLNRAREGLRVLEDTARFVWDEKSLFNALRRLRHALDEITREAYPRLVEARESGRDMGRRMSETKMRDAQGLVASNFRRAQEALRVLEEYGKVLSPEAVGRFKVVRFGLYAAEKSALRRLALDGNRF